MDFEKSKFDINTLFPSNIWREYLDTEQEGFNDWGGRGYDDFAPGEVTKTAPSGDETA